MISALIVSIWLGFEVLALADIHSVHEAFLLPFLRHGSCFLAKGDSRIPSNLQKCHRMLMLQILQILQIVYNSETQEASPGVLTPIAFRRFFADIIVSDRPASAGPLTIES
jgi:hypothetical protein